MTNTQLKAQIDSQITNETIENEITPTEVGGNLKDIVDYVDNPLIGAFLLDQTGTSAPTVTVLKNNTGLTLTLSRTSIGKYVGTFNLAVNRLKTSVSNGGAYLDAIINASFISDTQISISSHYNEAGANIFADELLNNVLLKIEIYN